MNKDMPEISEELTRHLEDLHRWYETDPTGYEAYLQGLVAESEERSNTMPQNKHLAEVDLSTLSPEEIAERLRWRDAHQPEVIRAEREREARRRLDEEMQNARDGFLLAGGDAKDWAKQEKQIRDELVRDAAKAEAEAAHAAAFRQTRNTF
jgi:hypothetical protein